MSTNIKVVPLPQVPVHRSDMGIYYNSIPIHAAPGIHEEAFNLLRSHAPSGDVLDLGAGSGAFSSRLNEARYNVTAVDFDFSGWSLTNVRAVSVDLNDPDAVIARFDNSQYDAIAAIEVVEHVENPCLLMRTARRLLKPNGVLLLTTPNVVSLDSRRLLLTKGELSDFRRTSFYYSGHIAILPYWLLHQLLEKEGFQVIETRFIGKHVRTGWKKYVVPALQFALLPLGFGVPLAAAFSVSVAVVCRPR